MKRMFTAIACCLLAGACAKAANNTQVKADVTQAQQIVQSCVAKGDFLTSAGRQAILGCIAPPGHGPQFQACVSAKLATFKFVTKAERDVDYQAIATCVEQNR